MSETFKKKSNYIPGIADIHMHILPMIDDGSESMGMSMEMLRSSYFQGVRKIFCTSHGDVFYDDTRYDAQRYFKELVSLCDAEFPDLELYFGAEVFMYPFEINQIILMLGSGQMPTLAGTNYVLAEYSDGLGMSFEDIYNSVKRLKEAGYNPIIAHVERYYHVIPDIEAAKNLHDLGCWFQINAYSVAEESDSDIRERTAGLLQENLVDFIGSDAHRSNHRPPMISTGVQFLYDNYAQDYVDGILYWNVEKMLMTRKHE